MGLPLYQNYYVVHDDDTNKIGFAPAKNTLITVESGTRPTRVLESTDPADPRVSIWSWIISAALVFAFTCCWVQLFFDATSRRNGKVDGGSFCCAATVFVIAFAAIVYYWVQPLINDFIIEDEDNYDGGMY